jgi:hypothetical protein
MSKLAARVLLTSMCLGYGICRSKLTIHERLVILGLAMCYVVSTGAFEMAHIYRQSREENDQYDAHDNASPLDYNVSLWHVVATLTDGCFAAWIVSSLVMTRNILRCTGQVQCDIYV